MEDLAPRLLPEGPVWDMGIMYHKIYIYIYVRIYIYIHVYTYIYIYISMWYICIYHTYCTRSVHTYLHGHYILCIYVCISMTMTRTMMMMMMMMMMILIDKWYSAYFSWLILLTCPLWPWSMARRDQCLGFSLTDRRAALGHGSPLAWTKQRNNPWTWRHSGTWPVQ